MKRETTTGPTPGPWTAECVPGTTLTIKGPDGFPVFRIRGGMLPVDADARLIASAPDLLAALRDALDVVDEVERSGCVCDEPPYCPEPGESGQVECPSCAARKVARLARAALSRAEGRIA